MADYELEKKYMDEGYSLVAGMDEAGRGPLAGPVVAACVILPDGLEDLGINDSKKLSEKKREELFEIIIEKAVAYAVCSADEKEIDEINILNATFLAMKRCTEKINIKPDLILVDGNQKPNTGIDEVTVVKGDSKSISVAAASILAKVTRDRIMKDFALQYPEYGFERHKGYGTKLHYEMIREYGVLPIHRRSFLKKMH